MEVRVNRRDLEKCVNAVQRAVSNSSPLLSGILINAETERIILTGNNMEIGIESCCYGEVATPGAILINSKFFGAIIKKLPGHEVILKSNDSMLSIESANARYELALIGDISTFPKMEQFKVENTVKLAPGVLQKLIKSTIHAIGQDVKRPILSGGFLEIKDETIEMTACDGIRLSKLSQKNNINSNNVTAVIPGTSLKEALMIFSYDLETIIEIGERLVTIVSGDTKLSTRLIHGDYLNTDKLMPKEFGAKISVCKKSLLQAIDRTIVICESNNKKCPIELTIQEDTLHVNVKTDNSTSHESIPIELLSGEGLKIAFNPVYFIDCLKTIPDETVTIEFTDSMRPCIIRNEEYLHFILPVRINEEE